MEERAELPIQGCSVKIPIGERYIVLDSVEVKYSDLVYGLRGVSLEIARGEFVFLIGKTGCGKSTLLKCLTRETLHTQGRVLLEGRDLSEVRHGEVPALRRGISP